MKTTWSELVSDKALVCTKEHRREAGVGTIYFVLLSDGTLLDCGTDRCAMKRAYTLAEIINSGGPEKLSHKALEQPQ